MNVNPVKMLNAGDSCIVWDALTLITNLSTDLLWFFFGIIRCRRIYLEMVDTMRRKRRSMISYRMSAKVRATAASDKAAAATAPAAANGAELPLHVRRLQVAPLQQRYRWDCGVTCVMMVLPDTRRQHVLDHFADVCRQEGFGKSTWTIDLVYLLHRFGVRHRYCTVTLGIDPGYQRQSFYGYGRILQLDAARVTQRFAKAAEVGVLVEERSVSAQEILQHVALSGPVIVLTDARHLRCQLCRANQAAAELASCLPWTSEYKGHYIVVYGYDLSKGVVFYRNPTFKNRECCMPLATLDRCRRSYGTDEDVVFVFDCWSSSAQSSTSIPVSVHVGAAGTSAEETVKMQPADS